MWPNLKKLLQVPEFGIINDGAKQAHVSKLEIGVLALLMCHGDQTQKAEFFYYLINPDLSNYIDKYDKELRLIFHRLIYFSIDLPQRYTKYILGEEAEIPNEKFDIKKYDNLFY